MRNNLLCTKKDNFYHYYYYYHHLLLYIIYILREFKELVIAFSTSKNTLNLINLFLFLKKRNKIKMVNQLKLNFPTTLTLSTFQPHYATFLTKNKKEKLPTHGSYKKKKLLTVPIKKIKIKTYSQTLNTHHTLRYLL